MKQRLAPGGAIIRKPRGVFLDEVALYGAQVYAVLSTDESDRDAIHTPTRNKQKRSRTFDF